MHSSKNNEKVSQSCQRVAVPAGGTVCVEIEIEIEIERLSYWDDSLHCFVLEPGDVELMVGASSTDIRERIIVKM